MTKKNRNSAALRPTRIAIAVGTAFLSGQTVWADPATNQLPTGSSVAAGTVSISTSGSKMQIDQSSDRAILNWQNFSIGKDGWVNFNQPSSSSVALNRSLQPAEIFGRLSANGQVFITSQSGVYFARSAQVDVGGLVASNLSIRDQDFMAGRYVFSNEGSSGSVVNDGTIITPAGYAALAGTHVRNNGVIVAQAGTVALAAGDRITLDMVGDGLIKVSVDAAALNALALNSGTIQADGGRVVLTARSANALLDTVVNNGGVIRARSLVERNGEIVLDGGGAGVVANSGSIDATGTPGTRGGSVQATGQYVALTEGSSIDASGDAGGGTVTVKAIDAAFVYGTISATDTSSNGKGGSVETSGKYLEVTRAPNVGAGGTWLIDPYNIDVVDVAPPPGYSDNTGPTAFTPSGDNSQIAAGLITDQLNAGANVILDTGAAGSPGAQAGDIRVLAAIDKTVANPAALTLKAFHDVQVNQPISIASAPGPTGYGTLTVEAGNDVVVSAPITTQGGGLTIRAGGFTNQSTINNGVGGDLQAGMAIFADRFDLAGGTINGGQGSVGLFTRTTSNSLGVESAGDTRISNADIASITTSPDLPTTNANQLLIGVGSGGTIRIGDDAQVNGGSKNLVFLGGFGPGTRITVGANGVTTTGDLVLDGSGGVIAGTGTIGGNHVALRASTGIGSSGAPVSTAANTLAVSTGGNAFVTEADNVVLDNVALMGTSFVNSVGGAYDFAANGSVTVNGSVFAAGSMNVNVAQDLAVIASPGRTAGLTSNGNQTISAANISLQAALSGNNGRAFIINNGGTGDQVINVSGGSLSVAAGAGGLANQAGIVSNGNQTINGNPEITITGGASGTGTIATNTHNSAAIQTNGAGKTQTVNAAAITVKGGSGNDAFAGILGANQTIVVSGDVLLTGGAGTGTPLARIGGIAGVAPGATNLVLGARDVVLTGGDAAGGGAGLGSTIVGVGPQPNTININATRDVILNGGTGGARIGTSLSFASPATGNIQVQAGRDIELNGAAAPAVIRSAEFVGLGATGNITESGNGFVQAGTLSTSSNGATNLSGPNLVSTFYGLTTGGDLTLNNTGALSLPQVLVTGNATITNAGEVNVTNSVNSTGMLTLNVAGALKLDADATHDAFVTSNGQTINAQSLSVTSRDGRTALLSSSSGDQNISVNGGSVDIQLLSPAGIAQVTSFSPSGSQSITVTNGDHIKVDAGVVFSSGNQTLSATGSGNNAIQVGSVGTARGTAIAAGHNQAITAGTGAQSGSITITGPAAAGTGISGFVTNSGVGADTQTISTSGTLRVTGGTAPAQVANFNSGIFHNRQGLQTIIAVDIVVEGGASGSNNGAFIASNGPNSAGPGGGAQVIHASGTITLRGSDSGFNNRASIFSNANQTIDGDPDITITAGSAGGIATLGNTAGISTAAGRMQTIRAGTLELTSGAGGTDATAFISGGVQDIRTTGDFRITGGGSGGTRGAALVGGPGGGPVLQPTILTLDVGRDLILTGGSATNDAASIGSSALGTGTPTNDITITVGRDVILNSGTGAGARIGTSVLVPPTDGHISITAGRNIELNGTAQSTVIRTAGSVELQAGGTISEATNGLVVSGTLDTTSGGAQHLVGPNQVSRFTAEAASGDVTLRNAASVLTLGTMELSGSLTIDQTGALAVPGTVGALNQSLQATGEVTIGSAGGNAPGGLFAPGTIGISTPQSIVLRGSDIASGGSSVVSAGGLMTVNAGSLYLTGGAAPLAAASMLGGELMVTSAQNIALTSGSGFGANALLYSGSDITMTIGGILTINGGHSLDNWARVQTQQYDGTITLNFPNASSGGFSVDGVVGRIKHGQDGLFTADKPAKLGDTLLINYGL